MRFSTGLLLVVAGCSSRASNGAPADASTADAVTDGTSDDGLAIADAACDRQSEAGSFTTVVKLDNAACSPVVLPCGCSIVFDGVTGGCAQPGLSPAPAADVAALQHIAEAYDASLPPGDLCVLAELPPSATPGTGCADESASGWCFVQGSCPSDAAAQCAQAACTTDGFAAANIAYAVTYLTCP